MSGLVPRHGRLRVLVLGQSCVGKTAMIVRFLTGRFIGDYDPTLETVYKHSIKIDGDLVDFEIFDTAKEVRARFIGFIAHWILLCWIPTSVGLKPLLSLLLSPTGQVFWKP
uniref:ras-related and estrogen-regulated growth inhibitor-like isoform X3 n=1 Tax=Myxine glutinosa TaxID=7769 RepID=UPI00358F1442